MSWQWFHRLGSPKWFYEKTGAWVTVLGVLATLILSVAMIWGLAFAPTELRQGHGYRIIFIHICASVVALGGYLFMATSGAIGLIWRIKVNFVMMKPAAQIGAVLSFLCLVTGSIWGKPIWGTFWEWDARNLFMLILLFLYIGIVLLMEIYRDRESGDQMVAILAIVGVVLIPIIYKSVDWWYSLHQTATFKLTGKSSINASMAVPIILMIIGTYIFYAWYVLKATRSEILWRERKTRWVKDLIDNEGAG